MDGTYIQKIEVKTIDQVISIKESTEIMFSGSLEENKIFKTAIKNIGASVANALSTKKETKKDE